MATVEELKLHVAASVEEAEQAMTGMRGTVDRLDAALARLRLVTIGSLHPSVAEALTRLEEAKSKIIEAQTLARGAVDSADTYRTLI